MLFTFFNQALFYHIHNASMTDLRHDYKDFLIHYLADHSVIPDAISPVASEILG